MRVELGTPVFCEDEPLGELADVVIDPDKRRLTHLVVQPHGESLVGPRLVPIELTRSGETSKAIALRCTREDFGRLEPVRELAYERQGGLPVDDPDWDVGIADVLTPAFGVPGELGSMGYPAMTMTYDRIPKDDVELRRSSRVQSSDGHDLGHVEALIVDDQNGVTHFVLQHRRLLGVRRNTTIPVKAITKIDTEVVTVGLARDQVRALPAERAQRR